MTETPAPESADVLASEVSTSSKLPPKSVRPGATRKGHSNGLKIHSIVFGSIALGVLVALLVAIVVIAGDTM